jgi:hypothetical protein
MQRIIGAFLPVLLLSSSLAYASTDTAWQQSKNSRRSGNKNKQDEHCLWRVTRKSLKRRSILACRAFSAIREHKCSGSSGRSCPSYFSVRHWRTPQPTLPSRRSGNKNKQDEHCLWRVTRKSLKRRSILACRYDTNAADHRGVPARPTSQFVTGVRLNRHCLAAEPSGDGQERPDDPLHLCSLIALKAIKKFPPERE